MNEDLLDFSELLNPKTDDIQAARKVSEYCRINLAALDVALERHAALMAYAIAIHEMSKVKETQAKWDVETASAQAYEIKVSQLPAGTKPVVSEIEKVIKRMPSVETATKHLHECSAIVGRMKGLVGGLEHRRDMLVQIASKQRKEM